MAQRKQQGTRRSPVRVQARAPERARPAPESVEDLVRERDRLRAELLAANAQIAALVARQNNVLNRIDWVIDHLATIVEGEA